MASALRLVVWTPSQTLLDADEIEWIHIKLAGARGLTIWPGHLPMLGETAPAALRYADDDGTHTLELPAGVVQVERGTVTMFLAAGPGQEWRSEREGIEYRRLAAELTRSLDQRRHPEARADG